MHFSFFFFFFFKFYLFIYLWLCWVFVSVRGLSPVVASGGHSSSRCAGPSPPRPLLLRSTGSRCAGSAIVATGPAAPRHVGSSQTRARTRVPCTGRRTPNHCATREARIFLFSLVNYKYFSGYLPNVQLTLLSVDPTKLTMEKSI